MQKSSTQVTAVPRSSSAVHRWEPTKPAPPVTTAWFHRGAGAVSMGPPLQAVGSLGESLGVAENLLLDLVGALELLLLQVGELVDQSAVGSVVLRAGDAGLPG